MGGRVVRRVLRRSVRKSSAETLVGTVKEPGVGNEVDVLKTGRAKEEFFGWRDHCGFF